ncbi:MAG TPA: hypothetical protein P5121_18450 [Caldilineaceae bacterium]|nr:hypothetical protein [Caldilineaceae bacterium]
MSEQRRPWYRQTVRWGQTNITELDATRYDIDWWRDYWQRTRVQGVIINAGGIVAYYPSRYQQHYRARFLDERDLFGELCRAAHEDGLVVLARMDSNRAIAATFQEHPEWFTRASNGAPYVAGDRYVTCVNSGYYTQFLPDILREIIVNYHPEGFTDNSWSGLSRDQICYCGNCERKFFEETGHELPSAVDWEDPVFRQWVRWSYDCRLAVWDLNNSVTQATGGPDCLWLGMNSGDFHHQAQRCRDLKAICERSEILMVDYQTRGGSTGFHNNGDAGKMLHGLLGWDKVMPESMAQYQGRIPTFRLASKPAPEVHLWMEEGIAAGIQPWWHFISAYHEDRRQYQTPIPLMQWHEANERYLLHRTPVATVGVLWSQENVDYYGRDQGHDRVMLPYHGIIRALIRARIPYLPVHAAHIARDTTTINTLILPNLAAISEAQVVALRTFVERGGNLVATGESTLYTEWGDRRSDFALADIFGVQATGETQGSGTVQASSWESYDGHSYLRLQPEVRAEVDGPHYDDEPPFAHNQDGGRHPVLTGFGTTDILPFGGRLEVVEPAHDTVTPLHWIPPFPIYPPEFAWMRRQSSEHPALVLQTNAAGGRIAYLPADIDRCYARYNLPDHGDLLANIVRWAAGDTLPLRIEGEGLVDCHLYQQEGRLILHLVNLTATGQIPVETHTTIGPLHIDLHCPIDVAGTTAQLLVAGQAIAVERTDEWVHCVVPTVLDHEVLVVH